MKRLIATSTVLCALAFVAVASANVLIYQTDFDKRTDVTRMERLVGGKACAKSWKGKKALGVEVTRGRKSCFLATPVEGDSKQPNYAIQATGKITKKKTDKKIRKQVYVGLAVRANAKSSYELRIYPKGKRWKLLKNGDAVRSGKEKAIAPLNKRERMRLEVEKSDLVARVNGKNLVTFRDNDPTEVNGRKTAVTYGSEARSNKNGYGVFQNVKAFVPHP